MDRTDEAEPLSRTLPTEAARNLKWWRAVIRTAGHLARSPGRSFQRVPEAIPHARVLGFVATLRLPLWGLLIAVLVSQWVMRAEPEHWRPTALGQVIDVALVEALSVWILLMVPVGLPLLYFVAGLLAHIALGLTGGTRQSIGATMRAFGYTAAPALLVISGLDLLLYLGVFADPVPTAFGGPELYACILGCALAGHYVLLAIAVARTHRVGLARGLLTALVPVIFFAAVTLGRAGLELERFPFVPPPQPSPYGPIIVP
jgi:hypothetical protein